jgi:hypothetical protein
MGLRPSIRRTPKHVGPSAGAIMIAGKQRGQKLEVQIRGDLDFIVSGTQSRKRAADTLDPLYAAFPAPIAGCARYAGASPG